MKLLSVERWQMITFFKKWWRKTMFNEETDNCHNIAPDIHKQTKAAKMTEKSVYLLNSR